MDGRAWGDELADEAFREATAGMDEASSMTTADDVCNTPHERGPQVVEHLRAADPLTRLNRGGAAVKATRTQHADPSEGDASPDAQKVTEALRVGIAQAICRSQNPGSSDAWRAYRSEWLKSADAVLAALDLPARDARVRGETLRPIEALVDEWLRRGQVQSAKFAAEHDEAQSITHGAIAAAWITCAEDLGEALGIALPAIDAIESGSSE